MAALVLFSVLIYLMNFYTIPVNEDMEYGLTGYLRRCGLSDDLNFAGAWNHIVFLYQDCNGRLIDKFPVLFLSYCPKWLFSLLNVGVIWLICGAAFKILGLAIGGNWRGRPLSSSWIGFMAKYPWAATAFIFLMMHFFCWVEMMLISYSLGYIWTSAVVLWLVYFFCNSRLIEKASNKHFALIAVASVIAGTMHELIPCVLCCAFIIPALFSGSRKQMIRRLIIITSLFIGYLVLSNMPGHIRRVGYTEIEFKWSYLCKRGRGLIPVAHVMPVVVFFLTFAVYMVWRLRAVTLAEIGSLFKSCFVPVRGRSERWIIIVTFIAGCIASVCIMSFFGHDRIMCYGILFSIMGGLILIYSWPGGMPRWFCLLLKTVLCCVAVSAVSVWSISIVVEKVVNRQFYCAYEQLLDGRKSTAFVDYPKLWWGEMINDLFFPWQMVIADRFFYQSVNINPLRESYYVSIVPSVFERMEDDVLYEAIKKSDTLPDGYEWVSREMGILWYNGNYLFTNPKNYDYDLSVEDYTRYAKFPGPIFMDVTFDTGEQRRVFCGVVPFSTPRSNITAYWLSPAINCNAILFNRIVSVSKIIVFAPRQIIFDSISSGSVDFFPNEKVYRSPVYRIKKN